MTRSDDFLYDRLPGIYRVRDAERGEPLRALLSVIGSELDRVQDDIAGLYDNWFIETCDEWVVPYIGDLVGARPIRSVPAAGVSTRAYVANTLAYRRRKGTAFVLEQLARDTTGWAAHAVEFFQRLATTQNVNHVRLTPHATPSIRNAARAELADTAFDEFAHLPEVRRAATRGGRYNIPNVGIYLWRLQSYPLKRVTARRLGPASDNIFAFHPAGVETPLFNPGTPETEMTHLAEEHNMPGRLRRLALDEEFESVRAGGPSALRFMAATPRPFAIWVKLTGSDAMTEVPVAQMYGCDMPGSIESASPTPIAVAIDPDRGRMRFPAALGVERVLVSFNYGFTGDLGSGPYEREEASQQTLFGGMNCDWQAGVSHTGEASSEARPIFKTLSKAVEAWNDPNIVAPGQTGIIAIMDSETDETPAGVSSPPATIEITVKAGSRLLIIAANWPKQDDPKRSLGAFVPSRLRPHIIADFVIHGDPSAEATEPGALFINGLLVEGTMTVDGNLGTLALEHSTLVSPLASWSEHPQLAALHVRKTPPSLQQVTGGSDRLLLRIERSILGKVEVAVPIRALEVKDSIVAAGVGSPVSSAIAAPTSPCSFESSTFEGLVEVQTLSASDCLFTDLVTAVRRQTGCMRFCYVPPASTTPRRYRCQPDLAVEIELGDSVRTAAETQAIRKRVESRIRPLFVSLRYGDPEYAQLESHCPVELRAGAEDGSEMGAYRFLQQPHREANLRTVLQEYLRFGLEASLFYVSY